jgi:hypothetical protein
MYTECSHVESTIRAWELEAVNFQIPSVARIRLSCGPPHVEPNRSLKVSSAVSLNILHETEADSVFLTRMVFLNLVNVFGSRPKGDQIDHDANSCEFWLIRILTLI